MFREIVLAAARRTPRGLKTWIHGNRTLDRVSRRMFSRMATLESAVAEIGSGPMAGLRLAVDEHTSHAHVSGTYELEAQRAIGRLVEPGSVCYDLGASIGYLSLLMARKAKLVFAFEPAPHAAREIRRHAEANGFRNITVVSDPVSDAARDVEFSLTDVAYGSCISRGNDPWPKIKLRTTTLDAFAAGHEYPDFIKIDVEGEEGRVLQGARSILRTGRTTICCELHSVECAREVLGIVGEYGYRVTKLDGAAFQGAGEVIPGDLQILAFPPGR